MNEPPLAPLSPAAVHPPIGRGTPCCRRVGGSDGNTGLPQYRLPRRARYTPPGQASKIAVTPCPPAAQIEISPRTDPPASFFFSASCLASCATMRPPVAANGCPAAIDEPFTLSLDRSIEPSAASSPSRSLQYSSDSHAASVASTTDANASWIS